MGEASDKGLGFVKFVPGEESYHAPHKAAQLIWTGYENANDEMIVRLQDASVWQELFRVRAGVAPGNPIVIKLYGKWVEGLEVLISSGVVYEQLL